MKLKKVFLKKVIKKNYYRIIEAKGRGSLRFHVMVRTFLIQKHTSKN